MVPAIGGLAFPYRFDRLCLDGHRTVLIQSGQFRLPIILKVQIGTALSPHTDFHAHLELRGHR